MTTSVTRPLLVAAAAVVAVAVVAAAAAMTVAAERSTRPSVDDVSADNPCLLVRPAELQAVLRSPVGGPTTDNVRPTLVGERLCQFQTTSSGRPPAVVKLGLVSVYPDSVFARYVGDREVRPVKGLPANAVWDDAANLLVAKAGGTVLTVLVFGAGIDDNRAAAVRIAERALERLA